MSVVCRTTMLFFTVLSVAAGLLHSAERSDDPAHNWHQWRGPLANGVAPHGDPPIQWDESTGIKWKIEVPGHGESTPIIWRDQVFLLAAIDTGKAPAGGAAAPAPPQPAPPQRSGGRGGRRGRGGFGISKPTTIHQFVVLGVDRATGAMRWRKTVREQVPHEGHHANHGFASASPTTDGRRLYASFNSRGVYCLDLEGNLLWQRDLGRMRTRNAFGEGASPTLCGDTLVVLWDTEDESFLYALDAETGATRWRVDRDEPTGWCTPLAVEHAGRTQVITNGTVRVRSNDLATGDLIWECGGQSANAIPSPVAADSVTYCVSGYTKSAAYAIPLDARGDITDSDKIVWRFDRGTPYVPSPLLYDNRLYFTKSRSAILTSLDTQTGKPVIDGQRLPGLSDAFASPVGAAGRIYVVGRSGTTAVIKHGDTFEELAVNQLDDPMDASPAIAGDELFLRGKKYLYCIAAE